MSDSKLSSIFRPIQNGALFATGFAATLGAIAVGFAAWNASMANVQPGDALTSTGWNAVVSNVLDLDSRTNAISSSVSNLSSTVNTLSGTVSTLSSSATKAPVIRVALAQCWGGCPGNHTVSTWHNVAAFNYTWSQAFNNDTTTFSHNGKWLVTVLKPGTYRIKLEGMVMPAATTSWVQQLCPFVSWAVNCFGVTGIYSHQYSPAGYWIETQKEFTGDLSANQTIAFGYYVHSATTYWAHDGYTALQVEKIN